MKYFSMFTGVGGFELGIRQAYNEYARECEESRKEECSQRRERSVNQREVLLHVGSESTPLCVGFSEIDKFASKLLQKKWPEVKNYGDATTINTKELPSFDLLVGGFPCQSFSIAGKRRGFQDTRGTMFFEIARILEAKKPRLVVLENVKGLLNHDEGKTFTTIIRTLGELGYGVEWGVLNSRYFGVPQNRERVFIIGRLGGRGGGEVFPLRNSHSEDNEFDKQKLNYVASTRDKDWANDGKQLSRNSPEEENGLSPCLRAQIGGDAKGSQLIKVGNVNPSGKGMNGQVYAAEGISPTISTNKGEGTKIVQAVLTPDRINKRQNGRRIKNKGEPSFTITGQDIHGVKDGFNIRRLTPLECERLQGFPDGWTEGFIDTQRYKMMGNAVTVNVVKAVIKKLLCGGGLVYG